MKKHLSPNCLNCETPLDGANYCPSCGQKNAGERITLRILMGDFLSDYFTFDSRLFRSLLPLLFKPAFLTKEYIKGRRRRYIPPLRLYIFITFIFFIIMAINSWFSQRQNEMSQFAEKVVVADSLRAVINKFDDSIDVQTRQLIYEEIDTLFMLEFKSYKKSAFIVEAKDSSDNALLRFIKDKGQLIKDMGEEGEELFKKEMVKQIPKILFLLLPIFALILKLLYIRHKVKYLKHLIFALHFHTFIFLILISTTFISSTLLNLGIVIASLVYLFIALRKFYKQGYFKTSLKFLLLLLLYLISFFPAVGLLIMIVVINV